MRIEKRWSYHCGVSLLLMHRLLVKAAPDATNPVCDSALYTLSNRANFPIVWLFYGSFSLLSIHLATKVRGRSDEEVEDELNKAPGSSESETSEGSRA